MFVKEILKVSADFLDMKNLKKYLENEVELTEEVGEELSNMLLCVNMVNNTIASSYIELNGFTRVDVRNELIKYSDISDKSIIEIKSIEDECGNAINFKIMPEGIAVSCMGELIIRYTYFPNKIDIDSQINHYLKINEITFAIGVVSEYLYFKGLFDDAYMWDKRFKSTLFNLLRPRRNIVMPVRRWK